MSLLDFSIDRGFREIGESSVVVGGFSLILKLGVGFISYSGELIIGDDGKSSFSLPRLASRSREALQPTFPIYFYSISL